MNRNANCKLRDALLCPSSRIDLAEVGRGGRQVRVRGKHRGVEGVERLQPELAVHAFTDPGVLAHRRVVRGGPPVAQIAPTGRGRLQRVRRTDLEDRLLSRKHVAHSAVGIDVAGLEEPVPGGIIEVRVAQHLHVAGDSHRRDGLEHRIHQSLPSADQAPCDSVCRVEKAPPRTENS